MTARSARVALVLAVAALWLPLLPLAARTAAQEKAPLVFTAEVDAIIHPVTAEYMIGTLDRAAAAGAAVVVFTLRTPGGLVDSTIAINKAILASKVPVVVYVAPSGSRAASAGFLIILAADVAAMAPGTNIGAAHPVSGSGEKMDETLANKAAQDLAAQARSLAEKRGRNVALAEDAVIKSRAFTEEEAVKAVPPLVDLVVPSLDELLRQLDGRVVTRFDGTTVTLRTAGAAIERVEMSWRQQLLSAIAHPQIAYLLLTLGTLGLTIELWNPGAILPGVVGGLCLLLAFFAFQILPVNYAGLLLILFGLVLLVIEIKVTSFGLLAAGGIVSLVFGSLMLIDSPLPELQLGLRVVLPVTLGLSAIVLFLVRLGVQSQRRRTVTGDAGMIGERGRALTPIGPGRPGRAAAHGEIWNAASEEPVAEGDEVVVTAVQGLTLSVRRAGSGGPSEGGA
jgi:membrane-bound serine protease (ClpP class)